MPRAISAQFQLPEWEPSLEAETREIFEAMRDRWQVWRRKKGRRPTDLHAWVANVFKHPEKIGAQVRRRALVYAVAHSTVLALRIGYVFALACLLDRIDPPLDELERRLYSQGHLRSDLCGVPLLGLDRPFAELLFLPAMSYFLGKCSLEQSQAVMQRTLKWYTELKADSIERDRDRKRPKARSLQSEDDALALGDDDALELGDGDASETAV